MSDFVSPADAFRIILRAIYPQNPRLPERIKSYGYFKAAIRRDRPPKIISAATLDHVKFPREAKDILLDGIRTGKIRLQGVLNSGPPTPIPGADCAVGDLDIFAKTLKIDLPPPPRSPFRNQYDYDRVWCSRSDVLALIAEYVPAEPAAPLGVTPVISPNEAVRALIEAHKDSDRPKHEIESEARAITGFPIATFPSMWKAYASPHQKRQGRRPRSVAAG